MKIMDRWRKQGRKRKDKEGMNMAVPWLRRLVDGLSPRRPRFADGPIRVEFAVDKAALGQVFYEFFNFALVDIILPWLFMLTPHLGDKQQAR
jgi:hypothetical protein